MRIGGLLLTGGASTRLGVAKHDVLRDGERLADRSARVLSTVCAPVFEVGTGVSPLAVAPEDPPGRGPLAALAAGTVALRAAGHSGPTIALAVDLPLVEPALLGWLASHPASGSVVPRVDGVAQSLCARYAEADLIVAGELVHRGERSLRALLACIDVTYVDESQWAEVADPTSFADVDTPDDLASLARFGVARPP